MTCPGCGADNREGRRFCSKCGAALRLACSTCGFINDPGDEFCGGCGQRVTEATGKAAGLHEAPRDAERRQLTVMFCDLVGSTALAARLDPEELREHVRAYQGASADVIARFEGHIAQYLGDGLLVYFGYPSAHEDDAQRAVRAGLNILEALEALNTDLARDKGVRLSVRVAIHTGIVVVGEMGSGGRHEHLAMGETPNVAARLQSVATPDTVVCSEATYRLVRGGVACVDLGTHALKGIDTPLHVYRVLEEVVAASRSDEAGHSDVTPLLAREAELTLLRERWAQSRDGRGQVVVLSGEAGIGKTGLVRTLIDVVAGEHGSRAIFYCSPYYANSALHPVIERLHRLLQWRRNTAPGTKIATLEQALRRSPLPLAEALPLMAALLSLPLPEAYPSPILSAQRQREKTQEALVTWLLAESARAPGLVMWEDLHWADPSTLELIGLLIEQVPTAHALIVLTCRPDFQPPWPSHSYVTVHKLARLLRPHVEELALRVTGGKPLPAEVLQQVVDRTDGTPLFVEELVKAILESDLLREDAGRYALIGALPPLAIPTTLQDALMARLDRLGSVKEVAQLCATLGREFTYELVRATTATLDETMLQRDLLQLVQAELLHQQGTPPHATYVFRHALIRDAAYLSLLRSTRRQYHQHIAEVLEARFPEITETQPELVAHHCTEAGLSAQAIHYWERAGQQASQRSANLEAVSHFTRGIELLKTLPETPGRTRDALTLYLALGAALQMAKGIAAPEVERAYREARAVCENAGETPELVQVLFGLWRFYVVRPELHTAREFGDSLLRLAQRTRDSTLAVVAHYALGATSLYLGELSAARPHLEEGIALYSPDQRRVPVFRIGQDLGVACRIYAATALWLMGYPDQALVRLHDALALAYELSHPYSLAWTRCWATYIHQFRRDVRAVQEHAEAVVRLTTEQGFTQWTAQGTVLRGWALAMLGQGDVGIAQVRLGITAWRAAGAAIGVPYFMTLLAEVSAASGEPGEGLASLAEAEALMEQQDQRWWEAEVYRLRGILLPRQTTAQQEESEAWLRRALNVARRQEATSLELRAAMSLAQLWQQQGRGAAARELLAPIHGRFTEGFETHDLREATSLLAELT